MLKLLIADDRGEIVETLAEFLCNMADCTVVTTLERLLGVLRTMTFDVCVVDLVYEGEGVLDIYNIIEKYPDTKFVVISAYTKHIDLNEIEETGRALVLDKPFTVDELVDAIQRLDPRFGQRVNKC